LPSRLKALADPTQLRLVSIVAGHDGGEACVCDLTEPLGLTQPTISHHLKILVDAGIFTRDKRGVWAYYALVPTILDALSAVLRSGAEEDCRALQHDRRRRKRPTAPPPGRPPDQTARAARQTPTARTAASPRPGVGCGW
jgi:DNA-binding transcriptional ArsR family regulator